jgi:diguanylate cyclase (GGDEF)-like protein
LIEVHLEGTEGETVQLGGLKTPPEQRATEYRLPLFHLPASEDKTIWIKTSNSGSYLLSFKLWSESEFDKEYAQDMMLYGIYFGILIVAITMFLIGFIALREIALLSLTCLTFSFTVFQTTLLGIGANQLWSPADYYRSLLALSLGASIIASYFFFSQGLKLKTESVIGEWVLRIIASFTLMVLLGMSLIGYQSTVLSLTYLLLASSIAVVAISFRMALKGNQLARFSSIASAAVLLGSVQQALVRLEMIPAIMHVEHAIYLGFLFLIGCLALGIGFEVHRRHNNYEQYKETLNAQNRAHQESLNLALESEVKVRTEELETALAELSSAHETLKHLNTVDQVTGTKNRYYFDTTFSQEWKRANREQYPLSILMLDVDHFKKLNDTYGHVVGDECLRQIGERLAGEIKRAADTLARFGGEEFVILLPYSSNENAVAMAEQLRLCIAERPLQVDGKSIQVFVSIGVSTVIPRENGLSKDLITSADQALYEAKGAGRNRVCNAGKLTVHNNPQDKKA